MRAQLDPGGTGQVHYADFVKCSKQGAAERLRFALESAAERAAEAKEAAKLRMAEVKVQAKSSLALHLAAATGMVSARQCPVSRGTAALLYTW